MSEKKWDRWKEIRQLGEGGQTKVYLVEDSTNELAGQFALKRLKGLRQLKRFEVELKAREKLDHALIPKVIDYDLEATKPYMVEEYVLGGDILKRKGIFQIGLVKTLTYFLDICEAVSHSHAAKVTHRDLKPANILYDEKLDRLKVTDFGICYLNGERGDERVTLLDERVGARDYTAPELDKGKSVNIGPHSDVYSLGKLLYWMISGRVLYREAHRESSFDLTQHTDNLQVERVSKLLDLMVHQEWEKRIQSVAKVQKKIREMIPLIEREMNIIRTPWPQKCIYCGLGRYQTRAVHLVEKRVEPGATDTYYMSVRDDFEKLGFNITPKVNHNWFVFVCEYCGNVQSFIRDRENKVWEDPLYQHPND